VSKGTTKYWTEEQEREFEQRLAECKTFAERTLVMTIRDLVKYDARTREGRQAVAKARLRLATASDDDLEELARLQVSLGGDHPGETVSQALVRLKAARQGVRERGVTREELGQ